MTKPSRRLGHKKSRNGCVRCKARRVKCDEQRPCSNCARHDAACSLLGSPTQQATSPLSTQQQRLPGQHFRSTSGDGASSGVAPSQFNTPSPATQVPRVHQGISACWPQSFGQSPSQPAEPTSPATHNSHDASQHFSADWLQSLRLMHHYCTRTCQVLSRDSSTEELWKVAIPEAASSYEFLMHGLLSLSALHYAYTYPAQRRNYTLISAHHQNLMLPYFATRLNDITEANCEAYFFLSSMIFLLSLCWVAHHETLERSISPNDVAQSFVFLQGVKGILDFRPIHRWRESGPLSSILRTPTLLNNPVHESRFLARLDKITGLARNLPMSADVINSQTACILALESLRTTYGSCRYTEERPGSVWGWPVYLPDLFIEMLGKGQPTALIILSHFAALVRQFEYRNWASEGWSCAIILMVEQSLDNEPRAWIDWPKRSIMEETDVDEMGD